MPELGEKVEATMGALAAEDLNDGPDPKVTFYRLTREHLVEMEVDRLGYGHTRLGDIDVSDVTQAVKIETDVHNVTKITLRMTAMPLKVRALGVVEIEDRGLGELLEASQDG